MTVKYSCNNCGMCCHTVVTGKITSCRYLKNVGNGKTTCKIYPRRLKTVIASKGDQVSRCHMRFESKWSFPGCPQNVDGKPCFLEHCKQLVKKQEEKKYEKLKSKEYNN